MTSGIDLTGPQRAATLGRLILAWGECHVRDLPWRRTRDPWSILVSEVMLQQTQVGRVVERYGCFIERFPSPSACARSPQSEMLRAWSGLGYNRRAVRLHQAACVVVECHGGSIPESLDELLALPGVGPYTARAVMAFAFECDVGVVDTNAARVLSRAVAGRALRARELQATVDQMVPAGRAWSFNQAILDLGATHCTSRRARCDDCPLHDVCSWANSGWTAPDPARDSAGTARSQPAFVGSDRQGRGRLIEAARGGPIPDADMPFVAGWPSDRARAHRVAASLESEGLLVRDAEGTWQLA
jgi:A/G-specific adenine glycosylase